MADVAADAGLYVEFSDKSLQDRYSQRREAAQAGRDYFTKSKAAQGGQQPEREQQAQKPDYGRGPLTALSCWDLLQMSKRVLT